MATLIKRRARKLLECKPVFPGYSSLNMPGLTRREHVTLDIGEHVMRIELEAAELLAKQILDIVKQYKNASL